VGYTQEEKKGINMEQGNQSLREPLELEKGYYRTSKTKKLWHREVYKKHYGKIPKGWVVYHVDGVTMNNAPENLIAVPALMSKELYEKRKKEDRVISRDDVLRMLKQRKTKTEKAVRELKKLRKQLKQLRYKEKQLRNHLLKTTQ
jgi:hypothetical protein